MLIFLIENDKKLLNEIGYVKNNNNRLSIEFKNNLLELNEDNLDHIKNQEEAIIEKNLNN